MPAVLVGTRFFFVVARAAVIAVVAVAVGVRDPDRSLTA